MNHFQNTSHIPQQPQIVGSKGLSTLINIGGNSCYINSCIQVLGHTLPLREYFATKKYNDATTASNNTIQSINQTNQNDQTTQNSTMNNQLCSNFLTAFHKLMFGMYAEDGDCIVQPITFRNTLISCIDRYQGNRQQDAHECLLFILQLLHNAVKTNPSVDIVGDNIERNPMMSWANFIKNDGTSYLLDLFYGQFQNTKKCLNCGTAFAKYDPMNCLSLEIPTDKMNTVFTLDDLLAQHVKPELMSGVNKYSCENCKSPQDAECSHLIWKCPNTLIVQLKRFNMNGSKILTPIDYPFTLDVRKYVSSGNQNQSTVYDLYAAIYHRGQLNGGHYYVSCKINSDEWWLFNDENCHQLNSERVVNPYAYVLFYKRRIAADESKPTFWNKWNNSN